MGGIVICARLHYAWCMEENLNSIAQILEEGKDYMLRFRRVLWKRDQWIIDELIAFTEKHIHAVAYAGHSLPFVMSLVAIMVEHQKQIKKVENAIYALQGGKRGNDSG